MVEMGCVDIITEVSELSSYLALYQEKRTFGSMIPNIFILEV